MVEEHKEGASICKQERDALATMGCVVFLILTYKGLHSQRKEKSAAIKDLLNSNLHLTNSIKDSSWFQGYILCPGRDRRDWANRTGRALTIEESQNMTKTSFTDTIIMGIVPLRTVEVW